MCNSIIFLMPPPVSLSGFDMSRYIDVIRQFVDNPSESVRSTYLTNPSPAISPYRGQRSLDDWVNELFHEESQKWMDDSFVSDFICAMCAPEGFDSDPEVEFNPDYLRDSIIEIFATTREITRPLCSFEYDYPEAEPFVTKLFNRGRDLYPVYLWNGYLQPDEIIALSRLIDNAPSIQDHATYLVSLANWFKSFSEQYPSFYIISKSYDWM